MGDQTTLPVSWETCMLVRKQQLEFYMEQLTGSKLGKEYVKPPCYPAYLINKQNTLCEMPRWIKNWNQDCWEKYQQPQISIWYHGKTEEELNSLLMRMKSVHFSSVTQLCPTLCDSMDFSTPGFPLHHQIPHLTQTHVHWVSDAIQSSYPLLSPSPPAFNLSQHQGMSQFFISGGQSIADST